MCITLKKNKNSTMVTKRKILLSDGIEEESDQINYHGVSQEWKSAQKNMKSIFWEKVLPSRFIERIHHKTDIGEINKNLIVWDS